MGLFDFAMDIGRKLFDKEEEGGGKIQQHIAADNPGVTGLLVELKDGVASLFGKAEDSAAVEKAVLMAGNVMGVKEVKADGIEGAAPSEEVVYHVIQKGDTLWALAKKHYGDGNKYPLIFEANREVIKDPDLIFVGQKIRIPKQ